MHCVGDRRSQHFRIRNAVNETISRASFIRMRRSAVDKASAATSLKSSAHREINQTISDGHTATINKLSIREDEPQEDGYRRKSSRFASRSLPTSLEEDSFMSVTTPSHRRFVAASRRVGISHVPHRNGLGGGELDCKQDGEISGISPADDVGALPATSPFFIKSATKTSACNASGTMVASTTVSSGAALLWNAAVASQLQEILLQHKIQPNTASSIISTCMQNAGLVEAGAVTVQPSSAEASPVVTKAATVDGEVTGEHGSEGLTSPSTSGSESNKRRKSPEGFTKLGGFAKLDPLDTSPFSRATFTADASMVDIDERTVAVPIYKPKSRLLAAAIADGAANSVTKETLTLSGLKTTAPVGTAVTSSSPIFVTDTVGTPVVTCASSTSGRPYTWDAASMTGGGMVCDLTDRNTVASSGVVASPPGARTSASAFLIASMRAKNASSSSEAASSTSMFVMPLAISPTRISATSTNIGSSSTIFGRRQSVPHAAPVFAPVTTAAGAPADDVEVKHATAETLDADDDVVILRSSGDKGKSSEVRTSVSGNSSSLPSQPHEQLHNIKSERSTPPGAAVTDTFTNTTTTTTTVSVRPSDGETRTSTEIVCQFTKSFPLSAVSAPDSFRKTTLKRSASQLFICDGLSHSVPLVASNISDPYRTTDSLSPLERPITSLSAECAGSNISSCDGLVKKRSAGQRGRPRHSESKSAKYARHHRNKMKSYRMKVHDERDRLRSVVAGQEAEVIELEKELLTLRQKIQHTYLQAPELLKPKLFLLIS